MELTPAVRRDAGPDLEAVGQDDELRARIHEEIERTGPITFARFMELALYDPAGETEPCAPTCAIASTTIRTATSVARI